MLEVKCPEQFPEARETLQALHRITTERVEHLGTREAYYAALEDIDRALRKGGTEAHRMKCAAAMAMAVNGEGTAQGAITIVF